jgi:hypothetical protein
VLHHRGKCDRSGPSSQGSGAASRVGEVPPHTSERLGGDRGTAYRVYDATCNVCRHAVGAHDRYCQATLDNALTRGCICAPGEPRRDGPARGPALVSELLDVFGRHAPVRAVPLDEIRVAVSRGFRLPPSASACRQPRARIRPAVPGSPPAKRRRKKSGEVRRSVRCRHTDRVAGRRGC